MENIKKTSGFNNHYHQDIYQIMKNEMNDQREYCDIEILCKKIVVLKQLNISMQN